MNRFHQKIFLITAFFLLTVVSIVNSTIKSWKNYTTKTEIRDIVVTKEEIWAVTSGGMFSFRPVDSSYKEYTTSEGLRTIDLTAITIDRKGTIWIGAGNGAIHNYDPKANKWRYVMDLILDTDPNKRINKLVSIGDTLFILSDLGLNIFSISRYEFIATYRRFGTGRTQFQGKITGLRIAGDRLWISSRDGIASTTVSNPNQSAPETWQVYRNTRGLPPDSIRSEDVWDLVSVSDRLYAGTSNGIAIFDSVTWRNVQGTNGLNVIDFAVVSNGDPDTGLFYFITPDKLLKYTQGGRVIEIENVFPSQLSTIETIEILGTIGNGILLKRDTVWISIAPGGPHTNRFVGIAIDEKGVLWSGTGKELYGQGFMSFDGKKWRAYTKNLYPILGSDGYYHVSIGRGNSKWIGSWGAGIAIVSDLGDIVKVLNASNGLLPSVDNSTDFVVVGGVAVDEQGVTWITNRTPLRDTALVLFHPDSSISYVTGIDLRTKKRVLNDVIIDRYGTKWFSNYSRFEPAQPEGLFYYNEVIEIQGTINNWGILTVSDGLTSNQVWSLAVGRDGELWVGTDKGINIIFDPLYPRSRQAVYKPLRDQIIQDIVVDPLNNKWVATKQGVFQLSPDGVSILEYYTVENTNGKLLDNDVTSIAIDKNKGKIYFGTEKGLSVLQTTMVEPLKSFKEIVLAPNPFYLPSSVLLTIDGLVEGSHLKILTVDGSLVRDIKTPGGRIGFWDGKDEEGNFVHTGIYLVVAYSEKGDDTAIGKVAVIRK